MTIWYHHTYYSNCHQLTYPLVCHLQAPPPAYESVAHISNPSYMATVAADSSQSTPTVGGVQQEGEAIYVWYKIRDDDVIKWKHFPRNWPFVREIHRSPVNFPHKGQRRGALMFSLIYAWINDWVNNRQAGDLRRQHGHYDVIVMENIYSLRPIRHQFDAKLQIKCLASMIT